MPTDMEGKKRRPDRVSTHLRDLSKLAFSSPYEQLNHGRVKMFPLSVPTGFLYITYGVRSTLYCTTYLSVLAYARAMVGHVTCHLGNQKATPSHVFQEHATTQADVLLVFLFVQSVSPLVIFMTICRQRIRQAHLVTC